MIFQPFYSPDTGCAAYVVGCGGMGTCAVVDAHEQDVERYIAFATSKGMKISTVIDTHVHADHRSGGALLAERAGAIYCLHAAADVAFPYTPVEDGDEIEIGNVRARVLHTPGHTPESICLLVTDLKRGPEPWFVLTGDTLFVGTVGRPDLPGRSEENAAELYDSLQAKILALPETLEVYPAHFSGSACGVGMSGKPMSTLGFEKQWNPLLSLSREQFVRTICEGITAKPAEMGLMLKANQGRS